MGGGICRKLDPAHVEIRLRFLKKIAVCAPDFEQAPAAAAFANELHGPRKLFPQNRLGAPIIGIAVRALAGEIRAGVIAGRIERRCLRTPESAPRTAQDIATSIE